MSEFNPLIAHISCNVCGKYWQVLNADGTDWDEQATAEQYHAEPHVCEPAPTPPPGPTEGV